MAGNIPHLATAADHGRAAAIESIRHVHWRRRERSLMLFLGALLVVLVVLFRLRRRGQRKTMLREPLAGLDTGCRLPGPPLGRFFTPPRGS